MDLTLISTTLNLTTAGTPVCEVDITSGIDDTYSIYEFHFYNIHPDTTASIFSFQANADGGSGWNENITSTTFEAENDESGSNGGPQYRTNRDQSDDAEFQQLGEYIGNTGDDDDLSGSGILTLYDPSSSTYVKHWVSTFSAVGNNVEQISYHAGYINTATAITQIRFKMTANDMSEQGDIEAGTIKLFGVS